jgi:hypothetical protein
MDVLDILNRYIDIPPSIKRDETMKLPGKNVNGTPPLVRMNIIKREMEE